jgi:hypothetical protein
MKFLISLIFIFTISFVPNKVYSQQLRSGEMSICWIGQSPQQLEYQASVTIFADTSIQPQKFLHISWGGGTHDSLAFSNPILLGDINSFLFNFDHTYIGNGFYIIRIEGPVYIGNINNIPNSSLETFYFENTLLIGNLNNHCPQFNLPQQFQWVDTNTIFDFSAFDPDGDSLSYELVPVSNYPLPNCKLDSFTGQLNFFPDSSGLYAIAVRINEWRLNLKIGSTMRQFLISVPSIMGIDNTEITSEISVYPSPTNNFLNIHSESSSIQSASISDLTGKIIYSEKLSGTKESLEVSSLSPGLYFINLETEKGYCTKKFIRD